MYLWKKIVFLLQNIYVKPIVRNRVTKLEFEKVTFLKGAWHLKS